MREVSALPWGCEGAVGTMRVGAGVCVPPPQLSQGHEARERGLVLTSTAYKTPARPSSLLLVATSLSCLYRLLPWPVRERA